MNMPATCAPYIDPAAERILGEASTPRRALFLDRDGVINVDHGYVHRAEQTDWLPGIFELAKAAHNDGMLLIVVTNQAGIGRSYYSEQQFLEYTAWMHRQFAEQGAPLLATYYCPHHPEAGIGEYRVACNCRKPQPGMLRVAIADWDISPTLSMMIGDKQTDLQAAQAVGVNCGQLVLNYLPTWAVLQVAREGK